MDALGLKQTYKSVMSANGPAQMLTYAFWGVLMAGMFSDGMMDSKVLILWGSISAAVVPVTIWMSKTWLRNVLLLDVVVSLWILIMFVSHEPAPTQPVYHVLGVDGYKTREMSAGHGMSDIAHIASLLWMTLHALYLADLINRQVLEKKRFSNEL